MIISCKIFFCGNHFYVGSWLIINHLILQNMDHYSKNTYTLMCFHPSSSISQNTFLPWFGKSLGFRDHPWHYPMCTIRVHLIASYGVSMKWLIYRLRGCICLSFTTRDLNPIGVIHVIDKLNLVHITQHLQVLTLRNWYGYKTCLT